MKTTKYYVSIDGDEMEVDLHERNGDLFAEIDGVSRPVDFRLVRGSACYSLLVGDESFQISYDPRPDGLSVIAGSESYLLRTEDERARAARLLGGGKSSLDHSKVILSMMPGIVREVRAAPGDEVKAGDALLILEAMKMENEIRAPLDGVVKTGDPLVTLE